MGYVVEFCCLFTSRSRCVGFHLQKIISSVNPEEGNRFEKERIVFEASFFRGYISFLRGGVRIHQIKVVYSLGCASS